MKLTELTVIVPTRNEEKNIPRFLASVPEAVELIVVDASEDRTVEILKRERGSPLRVLRYYGNISQARQLGADSARTPWLLFSDADVEFPPGYFPRVLGHEGESAVIPFPGRRWVAIFDIKSTSAHRREQAFPKPLPRVQESGTVPC